MAETYDKVIVFGPSGAVGKAVAQEAAKRGAQVWLAMRDPNKDIPGLPKETEQEAQFVRIKADLTDPSSIKEAIHKSKASAAFFYSTHEKPGMRDAIGAMKEAGIKYLVFLSSFTIPQGKALEDIPQKDAISWIHAQVEITLRDSGLPHTNLRPGSFASNIFRDIDTKKDPWKYTSVEGDRAEDCIVPADIGRVGGAVLVSRPSSEQIEIIYLFGPELVKISTRIELVEKASGRQIQQQRNTQEQHLEHLMGQGMPRHFAETLTSRYSDFTPERAYPGAMLESGKPNVKKYSGYEPTTFEEWVSTMDGIGRWQK